MQQPNLVSRFESNLLRILQMLLRRGPVGQTMPLVFDELEMPPCLSRTAVCLVEDTLAKGCISILAKTSGWCAERHLANGVVREGRLWDRHSVEDASLSFSKNTLRFLMWITAVDPSAKKARWPQLPLNDLTDGDRLFLFFAYGVLRTEARLQMIRTRKLFSSHALCRLAFPEDFADALKVKQVDFSKWALDAGAAVAEGLQIEFGRRWLEMEREKVNIRDWKHMQALGRSQNLSLSGFFDAIENANRRDLARFLMPVYDSLLPEHVAAAWWTQGLTSTGPRLADRHATNQSALALVRQMSRLKQWEQHARSVGYFDDDYAGNQLYLADWDRWHGDALFARASKLLQEIEPL